MSNKASKKRDMRILLVVVLVVVIATVIAFVHKQNSIFYYEKSLDTAVVTMKEQDISLRELTYYFMVEEETVNDTALVYNAENPLEYWGLYIDNKFVSDEARKTAVEFCIRDVLYSRIASEDGMSLSKEEQESIRNQAHQMYLDLTDKQKKLQITEEDLKLAMSRNQLADNYVLGRAKEEGLTISEDVLSAYYGINSRFFENVKSEHKVAIDQDVLKEIRVGTLTIN